MTYNRFIVLVENFQTGEFVSLGSTPFAWIGEQVRDFVNDFSGNIRGNPNDEPILLVWIKDTETNEVF